MAADALAPCVGKSAVTMILIMHNKQAFVFQEPLLLTWINFNPSMDK